MDFWMITDGDNLHVGHWRQVKMLLIPQQAVRHKIWVFQINIIYNKFALVLFYHWKVNQQPLSGDILGKFYLKHNFYQ